MGFLAAQNNTRVTEANLDKNNYGGAINQALANPDIVNQGQSNQTAEQQQQLAQMLMAQAQGQGPSLAQNQLQQATNRNQQQAAGMIASQRGMNPALAARQILQNQAMAGQQAAGQSSNLAMQEQMGAREQLGGLLGTQRGQDINQALGGINATTQRLGTVGGLQNQQNQTSMQNTQFANQMNADIKKQNAESQNAVTGSILGGIGSVGAAFAGRKSAWDGGEIDRTDGGDVPGQAKKAGDHPDNDTVPAMLSPGEVVIPRSMADDGEKAKEFINALKAGKSPKQAKEGYGKVLEAQKNMHDRLSKLEQLLKNG